MGRDAHSNRSDGRLTKAHRVRESRGGYLTVIVIGVENEARGGGGYLIVIVVVSRKTKKAITSEAEVRNETPTPINIINILIY